jgi:hypothetical protein
MRTVYETEDSLFRIVEINDTDYDLENLKGDCYSIEANPDVDAEKLKQQEKQFDALVEREGVFGYVLERWNPKPGRGYEHLDSCFGFVGQYSDSDASGTFNHYIVQEMKDQILELLKKTDLEA